MGYQLITEPDVEPVTLELAKAHLRITHDNEDELIRTYVVSARKWVEEYTRRALITQTWDLTLEGFATTILLPFGRTTEVQYINYYDSAGVEQTLTGPTSGSPVGTDYQEDLSSDEGAFIRPAVGDSWPSVQSDRLAPVTVRFDVGFGMAADVPASLVTAILYRLTDVYEFRGTIDDPKTAGTGNAKQQASAYRLLKW